jgi:hypothetical protein
MIAHTLLLPVLFLFSEKITRGSERSCCYAPCTGTPGKHAERYSANMYSVARSRYTDIFARNFHLRRKGGSAHSLPSYEDGSSPNVLFGHTDAFLGRRAWEFASGSLTLDTNSYVNEGASIKWGDAGRDNQSDSPALPLNITWDENKKNVYTHVRGSFKFAPAASRALRNHRTITVPLDFNKIQPAVVVSR